MWACSHSVLASSREAGISKVRRIFAEGKLPEPFCNNYLPDWTLWHFSYSEMLNNHVKRGVYTCITWGEVRLHSFQCDISNVGLYKYC
uniref:Uncharacterized protein n=1 Tax=Pyxicephalus adspersus TaxID=30357 RepID=A0AAV3AGP6_PYXAD|nr:TPA: hypothetical protein GDO54_014170 [Pyxicephalus adspersus]